VSSEAGRAGTVRVPRRTVGGLTHSRLVLGGAQLGGAYGIANTAGAPDRHTVANLLRRAADAGITHVDTARAYGDSERHIGRAGVDELEIVTKVAPLPPTADRPDAARAAVQASVSRSLAELRRGSAIVLMHRAADARVAGGAAWDRLREYAAAGVARRIGVSVQSPAELAGVIDLPDLGYVQLPTNVLDTRWRATELAAHPDMIVVARSVYLQGLLAAGRTLVWPTVADPARDRIVSALDEAAAALGYSDRLALCLAYVLSLPWVTAAVVGAETVAQLERNIALAGQPLLGAADLDRLRRTVPEVPASLLDPSRWGAR
jgi:aryl-alcohol dehydrogenase-like predicted oxidoreductase